MGEHGGSGLGWRSGEGQTWGGGGDSHSFGGNDAWRSHDRDHGGYGFRGRDDDDFGLGFFYNPWGYQSCYWDPYVGDYVCPYNNNYGWGFGFNF
jgi:hypothetical protein